MYFYGEIIKILCGYARLSRAISRLNFLPFHQPNHQLALQANISYTNENHNCKPL